jgi:hypothetical protein
MRESLIIALSVFTSLAGLLTRARRPSVKYITCFLLLSISSAAAEGTSRGHGMGGWFTEFDPIVAQYNQSGELFRIQGHCQSACTTFLGIRNVCVERSASLLFHGGHDYNRNITAYATDRIMSHYNASLRQYLTAGGYMKTLAFHTISGADMIRKFAYKECPAR